MAFISIDDFLAGHKEIRKGDLVAVLDQQGKIKIGTVKIKLGCPEVKKGKTRVFSQYAYAQYRDGEKVRQKYLGVFQPDTNTIYKKR